MGNIPMMIDANNSVVLQNVTLTSLPQSDFHIV
jgi:hypothetical protein